MAIAFLLSAFAPWSIVPILMLGGIYLAYEGTENIFEYFVPHHEEKKQETVVKLSEEEILKIEKVKIKSAILTDFILSIEIIIMALGTVLDKSLKMKIVFLKK